jgi:hypothetical protein
MNETKNRNEERISQRRGPANFSPLADIKLGFRREEAAFVFGSTQLVDEMIHAKWLTPVVNRHKLQIFDRGQISRAWARILNGEEPPRLARSSHPIYNKAPESESPVQEDQTVPRPS